ncbi:MAG: DUF4364 family protein [Oscillospiraceae bacterium]|nr:DUF4364 family protein [Oscillospiraceae bacterium]
MRKDLNSENEIKIFILYLMNQINHGVNYDDIANMTYESGYVGYFDFAEIFAKLIGDKNIEECENNIYNITQRGKAIAENLEHLIPLAPKVKGIAAAARRLDLEKSGAVISHIIEEETDGNRFKCSIKDKNENREILNISLFIKDKITAEKISEKFKENPNAVYRGIYAMLTGDADFLF